MLRMYLPVRLILAMALMLCLIGPLYADEKQDMLDAYTKGGQLIHKGEYAAAVTELERALAIAERVLPPGDPDLGTIELNLAFAYAENKQPEKAEPHFVHGIQIAEAALGPNHRDVTENIYNLAEVYRQLEQFAKAEPLYLRNLKSREAGLGADHLDVAITLHALVSLYLDMGQFAKAEPLCQRCLKIRQSRLGPTHTDVADSLNSLGQVYKEMGQFAKAEPLYQRSLSIRQARFGQRHPKVAVSLNCLAILNRIMGQYDKAEAYYQRCLAIDEATFGADSTDVADDLNNLAMLYFSRKQFNEAEPLLRRSLEIREAKLRDNHSTIALCLFNLASVAMELGKFEQAETLLRRSQTMFEANLEPDHPLIAKCLQNIGRIKIKSGKPREATESLLRSVKAFESRLGSNHIDLAHARDELFWSYLLSDRPNDAIAECDKVRRIVRRYVADVLPVLSQQEQLTFIANRDRDLLFCALSYGLRLHDRPGIAEASSAWLFNGKAVIQQSLSARVLLARDSANPALAEAIKQLLAIRTELARLSLVVPTPEQQAEHREKLAALADREQELSRQINQAAGRGAQDNQWIEPAAVRAAVPADAVLVDIVRLRPLRFGGIEGGGETDWQPERYVAWVVPPTGKGNIEVVDLGDAVAIDQAVEAARKAIEQSAAEINSDDDEAAAEQAATEPLAKLAELVLAPLKPRLAGVKQLVLSPDSNLWLVPWAALPVGDGKYAIESWQIRYVTSGRDLVAEKLADQGTRRELSRPRVFADPDYDLSGKATLAATRAVLRGKESQLALRSATDRSGSGLKKVGRLPATAVEAKLIAPSLEQYAHEAPTVYSEQYALEGVLKSIASPRVLVLSTHGYYLPDQQVKVESKAGDAATSSGESNRSVALTTDGKPLENPLLRCGLLLAGCNQPPTAGVDDGVLTGMEIVGCDLRGTDLVVLSACQTGLGQVRNGEGVAGLRQAFQLAGAKAVVSTLWRIPDAETATLMSDFFANLAAGQSKAEALRGAQLTLIKARRDAGATAHPFYWAAFTVTGN